MQVIDRVRDRHSQVVPHRLVKGSWMSSFGRAAWTAAEAEGQTKRNPALYEAIRTEYSAVPTCAAPCCPACM